MSSVSLQRGIARNDDFYQDVVAGLSQERKTLPCKYFYDTAGSLLFEQICQLEEYYVTRTEIAILRRYWPEMAALIGPGAHIMEFGAGSGIKTELLLAGLAAPAAYIPIEISTSALVECAQRLSHRFPQLAVKPMHADYMDDSLFGRLAGQHPLTIFFPGSTLGNFEREEAAQFLRRMRELIGDDGGILIGIDLMKDESVLIPAYDDARGITAAFNKNLLARINGELDADFELENFVHQALVNQELQRVEMHLVSLKPHWVTIGDWRVHFKPMESIHTENSHKYTLDSFRALAAEADLESCRCWTDEAQLFSMHYLRGRRG